MAVGDLNGDGKEDLAVACRDSDNVAVLLGNGDGTFTGVAGSPFAAGDAPVSVAMGDLNGDGAPDLAVANNFSNNVSILLGNGQGSFVEAADSPFAVGSSPASLAMGDFDGDGIPDLAVANTFSDDVSVLMGIGNGNFVEGRELAAGYYPIFVALGDINQDEALDVVAANDMGFDVRFGPCL